MTTPATSHAETIRPPRPWFCSRGAITIFMVGLVVAWWAWHEASRRTLASVLRDGAGIVAYPGPATVWNLYGMTGSASAHSGLPRQAGVFATGGGTPFFL